MKTLLVPCDFSETSNNALQYAISLANDYKLNIVLQHAVVMPDTMPETAFASYNVVDAKNDALDSINKLKNEIQNKLFDECEIVTIVEIADPKYLINKVAIDYAVDFIIMGISGHGSSFTKFILGSTATAMAKESDIPVLIIPPKYTYSKITSLAFANDYSDENINDLVLSKVAKLCSMFNAKLNILHVVPSGHFLSTKESNIDNYIEHEFETTKHSTFIINDDKITTGLLNFIENHKVDIVITEPREHSFLYSVFHSSTSKDLAFFSPIPVLNIHQ